MLEVISTMQNKKVEQRKWYWNKQREFAILHRRVMEEVGQRLDRSEGVNSLKRAEGEGTTSKGQR